MGAVAKTIEASPCFKLEIMKKTDEKIDKRVDVIFVLSTLLFLFGGILCYQYKTSSAIATYGAAVLCLVFVYLDKFDSFEGFGIKAKVRFGDKTVVEKDAEIVEDLRQEEEQYRFQQERSVMRESEQEYMVSSPEDWVKSALFMEEKTVEYVVNEYKKKGYRIREFYKQRNILVGDFKISVDGFIQLKQKDIFIEVKVSRTGHPPVSFLERSLIIYIAKINNYRLIVNKDTELEFVLVGHFQAEYKDRILNWFKGFLLKEKITGVNFKILDYKDVTNN